jgi:hypothetical protein
MDVADMDIAIARAFRFRPAGTKSKPVVPSGER